MFNYRETERVSGAGQSGEVLGFLVFDARLKAPDYPAQE